MQDLKVLYETNHVIVIEKPVNVPSQGDKTGDIDCLSLIKDYLKEKYNKPGNVYVGLVHRLDRPVGGVMVFAKTSKAASRLSEAVRERELIKEYLLVADGKFEEQKGIMEDYLKKDERTNLSKVVKEDTKDAKYAKLEYEVLSYREDNDISLVKVKLDTGRHHQIRVQFASRGHSLYGDQKYGTRGKGKQIALYAFRLTFPDPVTKEMVTFTALPEANGTWSMLKNIEVDKI
ncbi:MAG: RluA family pseudouridine synthase [Clostridia bacterium]|nr:RluA family pseudouridine synthase [Clostridia bacterium]